MNISIRHYENSDFDEIHSWWLAHDECPPSRGMMIEDGTFIFELDGNPVMTITALTTQSKMISYLEGYCANPSLPKEKRNECGEILWDYALEYLRKKGFKRVNVLTDRMPLVERYQRLGMEFQMFGLQSLGREL